MAASRHRAVDGVKLITTEADLEYSTWLEARGRADLVVECASVAPAGEYGPAVIAAGTDLVLTSVGDLVDPSRPTGAQRCQGVFLLVGDP